MKRLILFLLCALPALAQSTEVVQTTSSVTERKSLENAVANFSIDGTGTNVVLTQLSLTVKVERKIGTQPWEKTGTIQLGWNRDTANAWVATYLNAQGQSVTNNLKVAALADCDRVELLALRAAQLIRTPKAMDTQ